MSIFRKRTRCSPSQRDLEIFYSMAGKDLLDKLYTGMTGSFQIAGHRQIARWASCYTNNVVVEIGCGHGHHLQYGNNQYACYFGLDIEYDFLHTLRERFPGTHVINGDAYALPFKDHSVDRVLSVYNFEHLRHLSACLKEIHRILKPDGELLVGLPAEGGLLYGIGRWLTSKRYMERKYSIDYMAIVHWEHWNTYKEVVGMLKAQFVIITRWFIPFWFLPTVHANVIGCLRVKPRPIAVRS